MKKNFLFAATLLAAALVSCSQYEHLDFANENYANFTGTMEIVGSRTVLDDNNKVVWDAENDEVSIFEKDNVNSRYAISNVTAEGVANFKFVSFTRTGAVKELAYNYAVYPYSSENTIDENGTISAPVAGTFMFENKETSIANALMVAKSENTNLKFTNAQGILLLRLNAQKPYKYGAIRSIKLSSSKNQLLSGTATMSWDDGVPLAVISNGSNELNVELATALQVELPASQDGKYAEYYIPIVPTEFMENDFTFIITWADGTTYTKTVASPFKVGRKMIKGVRHTIGTSFEGVTEDAEEVWNGESTEEITPDENGVYNITKPAQLAYLASRGTLSVNDNNVETVTINLQKNLDMGNGTVSALIAQRGDVLTFNGNGYTISNVNIVSGNGDNTTGQAGLFYCFPNSKLNVSDLNLENIAVTADENSTGYAAAIVGYCEGTTVLNNVNVMNANVRGTKSSGMLAGHMSGSLTAMNCKVGGDVTLVDFETGGHYAGEYVGTVAGSVALTACTENVTVGGNLKDINVGKFYGRIASGALVIDGATVVATTDALATAVASGLTDLYLMPGEYKNISGCAGKTLTFNGTEEAILKLMNQGEDGCDYAFGSASAGVGNVTFNGLTIDTSENTGNYKGYAYMKGTFNRCSFIGAYSLNNANAFVFNNCVFDFKNGYFWTWGANQVTFDGCEFYGNSKTILAHGGASTIINIKDCKFNATEKGYTGTGDNTACVEIDPTGTNAYTVNFMGNNTINDNYAGWIRIKDGSIGHIITGLE